MDNIESRTMYHDQLVSACRSAASKLNHKVVGRAFVASFSSRQLDWRGVLPCYAVCRQLPEHDFTQSTIFTASSRGCCSICGLNSPDVENTVSGEVLTTNLGRAYYLQGSLTSLEQFNLIKPPLPTKHDISKFSEVIQRLRERESIKLGQLQKTIQGVFPSNKFEREDVIASLALAGVFAIDAASYMDGWVTHDIRESIMPSHSYAKDSPHPLRHYNMECSLNEDVITYWFDDMAKPCS